MLRNSRTFYISCAMVRDHAAHQNGSSTCTSPSARRDRKEIYSAGSETPVLSWLSVDLGNVYALSGELRNAGQAETDYAFPMIATS